MAERVMQKLTKNQYAFFGERNNAFLKNSKK